MFIPLHSNSLERDFILMRHWFQERSELKSACRINPDKAVHRDFLSHLKNSFQEYFFLFIIKASFQIFSQEILNLVSDYKP